MTEHCLYSSSLILMLSPPLHFSVPAQVITPPQTFQLTVGQSFTMDCEARGTPNPRVRVLRLMGGQPELILQHNSDDTVHPNTLFLPSVTMKEQGTYYCYAYNVLVNPPLGKRMERDLVPIGINVIGKGMLHLSAHQQPPSVLVLLCVECSVTSSSLCYHHRSTPNQPSRCVSHSLSCV